MSNPRALANQKLYHARILIDAWQDALQAQQIASSTLQQAFGLAICDYLAGAYGWFLLEIAQPPEMPAAPPRRCADLPAVAQGRVVPPEILEFQQLEGEAWLAQILDPVFGPAAASPAGLPMKSPSNLALSSEQGFSPGEAERWHARLGGLFERMSDSLDEY